MSTLPEIEVGHLVSVHVKEHGSAIVGPLAAGTFVVPLANADDFVAPGLVEINEASYVYNSVTDDGELELDTALVADVDEDAQAFSLSWPGTRQVTRTVDVRTEDDGDPIPATIVTGTRGYFREGDVDAGALVAIRPGKGGYEVVGRIVDEDELSGVPVQTSATGARVVMRTAQNIFEAGEIFGLLEFHGPDPSMQPALVWARYDAGTGSIEIRSPYTGSYTTASFLNLGSDNTMTFGADSFFVGSGGTSIDFHADSNQFQFLNAGGSAINFGYTVGENVVSSRDNLAARMRLTLRGSDLKFDCTGEALYMMQATGVARAILAHEDLSVALMWGDSGQLRVTNLTGTNFNPIEASAFTVSSDGMNKSREVPLAGALEAVCQWQAKDYETTQGAPEGETVPGRGFIAQEMAEVTPELVKPDEGDGSGLKIDVMGTVATLAAAVKELTAKVDALEARVAELEK